MTRRFATLARAAALTALAAAALNAHAVNLIKDGGFEAPLVPVGGFTLFEAGTVFGSWTVVGVPGDVAIVSTAFVQNGIAFKGKAGQQWLDMTGLLSDRATGVAQTVKTVPGQSYVLTFSVGNVVDPNNVFGSESSVDVQIDGVPLTRATYSGGVNNEQRWRRFSTSFVATAKRTTIAFINADPLNDNSNGLDAVTPAPSRPGDGAHGSAVARHAVVAAAQTARTLRHTAAMTCAYTDLHSSAEPTAPLGGDGLHKVQGTRHPALRRPTLRTARRSAGKPAASNGRGLFSFGAAC